MTPKSFSSWIVQIWCASYSVYWCTFRCIGAHQASTTLWFSRLAEALHNWSGQLNSNHYSSKCVGGTTADILFLISLTGLKITLLLCLLLRFLHNRIPWNRIAWAADILSPLDILFLSISYSLIYNKPNKSKNHTSTFRY